MIDDLTVKLLDLGRFKRNCIRFWVNYVVHLLVTVLAKNLFNEKTEWKHTETIYEIYNDHFGAGGGGIYVFHLHKKWSILSKCLRSILIVSIKCPSIT